MRWISNSETLDRLGIAASLACGIHCVLAPLVLGAAAVLPVEWLFSRMSETIVLTITLAVGASSLIPGYLRRHRRRTCLAMFLLGGATLLVAKIGMHGGALEPFLLAAGAVLISVAHLTNLKLCRSCVRCG